MKPGIDGHFPARRNSASSALRQLAACGIKVVDRWLIHQRWAPCQKFLGQLRPSPINWRTLGSFLISLMAPRIILRM